MTRVATDNQTLTTKQEKFCQLIVGGANQSDAYRAAYNAGKMPDARIWSEASTLAAAPKVARRIQTLRDEAAKDVLIDAGMVLKELCRIGSSDPRKLVKITETASGPATMLKNIDEWDDDLAAAVASVELDEFGAVKKVKFWPKVGALELLGRHTGIFEVDNAQKSGMLAGLPRELVKTIRDRLEQSRLARLTSS